MSVKLSSRNRQRQRSRPGAAGQRNRLLITSTTAQGQGTAGKSVLASQRIDRVAGLYVSDKAGTLIASAGQDVNLIAAVIDSAGAVQIGAGRGLNLGTVRTERSDQANWNANNHLSSSASSEVGTQIQSQGNTTLRAGQDINARAADVQAQGALGLQAGRDVNLSAGQSSQGYDQAHQSTIKGLPRGTRLLRVWRREAMSSSMGWA